MNITSIDQTNHCKKQILNVQTTAKSVLTYELQNLYLLENYLQCLFESQKSVEKIIDKMKMSNENSKAAF